MKLAIVGGGSTYTPELVDGLTRLRADLPVTDLALIDPSAERLDAVGGMARRMLARQDHPARVLATSNLDEGIEGADAVLLQLRVGGQAARDVDETLPLRFCCVGQETTGAGGLAKALRTVPVVLDIAARVRDLAPKAWIVDFTNPVGIVTRALLEEGHRAVGLCNVAIGFQRRFADACGVPPHEVALDHFGLNHLTWIRAVHVNGRDVLPEALDRGGDDLAAALELPVELLRRLGVIPSYYLRYYYAHDEVVREQRDAPSRASAVAAMETTLLDMYRDPAVDTKPELLAQRGGAYYSEAAIDLLASLATDRGDTQVVNLRNDGTLPFLPDEAVIEVPAVVGAHGATAHPVDPVPALYRGLIAHVTAYEELALDAARRGGRDRVAAALLAHPLIGQYDLAEKLTDALLAANTGHLPWVREAS